MLIKKNCCSYHHLRGVHGDKIIIGKLVSLYRKLCVNGTVYQTSLLRPQSVNHLQSVVLLFKKKRETKL